MSYCRHPERDDYPDVEPYESYPRSPEQLLPAMLGWNRVCVLPADHDGKHVYDISTEVQRGWRAATSIPALVDACRQDLATAGAYVFMLKMKAEYFPELEALVQDLEAALKRTSDKLTLAMDAAVILRSAPEATP